MIANMNDQGLETVKSLFNYATLHEVLEEIQRLETQQGSEYAEIMTLQLLAALEQEDDPNAIEAVLSQFSQTQVTS